MLLKALETPANLPLARELWMANAAPLLKQVDVPALIMIGKKDIQVDWQTDGEPLQHIADLRPTTMNDDRMDADLLEEGDVARERIVGCAIGHRVPTILDQDGPPGIAAQVRQCLVEDRGSDGRVGGGYDGGRGGGNHRAGTLSRSPRRHHPWPGDAEQQI